MEVLLRVNYLMMFLYLVIKTLIYKKMKKVVYSLILLIGLVTISSCGKYESSNSQYKYEVTGTSSDYSVTIQNTDDNTQQWS